jgi:hypothetical protein
MKWFAILPVELRDGKHAWLRWVWKEESKDMCRNPVFLSQYMEIDEHILDEAHKEMLQRFPIHNSMTEEYQKQQRVVQYGFIEGARAALRNR